jgi:hypothetical protein
VPETQNKIPLPKQIFFICIITKGYENLEKTIGKNIHR